MWNIAPDRIEYWFDLEADTLVMAFHKIVRELEHSRYERVRNITIEYVAWDKERFQKKYTMIVMKSDRPLSKYSLIESLKKYLVNNKGDWRRGR